jgi:hypothetical protein
MADKKNAFLLYKDQWESISDLDDKYLGQLFRAIFEYQVHGITPENHSVIYRDFKHFKPHFDRDDTKYQSIVEKKKLAGAEGGKQRAAKLASASISQQGIANVALNDNDNVNDINNTPISPFPPEVGKGSDGKKSRKKSEVEMTLDSAKAFYKTESEAAEHVAAAAAAEYRKLAYEICGMRTMECPNGMVATIMRMPEQLTFEQYQNLCKIMGGHNVVRSIMLEMHNGYKDYLTKRISINLVAQDWYSNRVKKEARASANGFHSQPQSIVAKNPRRVEQP